MSNRNRRAQKGRGRRRNISARGVRRETPDARRLSRALLDFAIARDEAAAEAERRLDGPTQDDD